MSAIEEARRQNRLKHAKDRQQAQAGRGPKGVAEAWFDRARALAKEQESRGNPEAWSDLARCVESFCQRYAE